MRWTIIAALVAGCSASSERAAPSPDPRPTTAASPTSDAAPPDAAPARTGFDPAALSDDVEPCVGRNGAYMKCVARVVTGHRPKSLRFSPDGKELWVALHYDKPAVAVYDTASFALVGAVELGEYGAVELAFSPDGDKVYFSQFETATVFEIDRATRKVTRTFPTGSLESKVVEVAPDGSRMWVANWKGNDVSEFDLATGKLVRALKTPGIPRGLYATRDGKHLYVAGYSPGRLYRFDRASGEMTILSETGASVRHIVADEERGRIYASDLGNAQLLVYDVEDGTFERLAETDPKPNTIDLSPDRRVLFVSNRGANNPESYLNPGPEWGTVLAFDASTGRKLDAAIAGNQSTGLSVSPDGRLLATTDFLDNRINVYLLAPTDEMIDGRGGNANTYRAHVKKRGDWGSKAPRDPTLWDQLAPTPPAEQ